MGTDSPGRAYELLKRDGLLDSRQAAAPAGPRCGPRLPGGHARVLAQAAARHGVWFVPGPSCSPTGGHPDHLRLAFVLAPDRLRDGVARLAAAWGRGRGRRRWARRGRAGVRGLTARLSSS
jgi:hypothetical protein